MNYTLPRYIMANVLLELLFTAPFKLNLSIIVGIGCVTLLIFECSICTN